MPMVTLAHFLTRDEIQRCADLWQEHRKRTNPIGGFAQTIANEIIEPNIARINTTLGQQNDPKFLAYMVEFMMLNGEH